MLVYYISGPPLHECGIHTHGSVLTVHVPCMHTDQEQLLGMAGAFAALPCKVLWRLTPKEAPDEAAIAALGLGNNTQVLPLRRLSAEALLLAAFH